MSILCVDNSGIIENMKELNFQEQAFCAVYLDTFNARKSALDAGYSVHVADNHAWSWVSITGCPPNKRHVRDYIQAQIDKLYGSEQIDKQWLLKRCKIIAEFNISKFIRQNGTDAVYDFSNASLDDWYCIEEYATEQSFRRAASGEPVPVDKLKIKTPSKIAALKLLGDHVDIKAFSETVDVNVVDRAGLLAEARERAAKKK